MNKGGHGMAMSTSIFIEEPGRKIKVIADVDVLIIGGGPAGIAAAVSASRAEAHTLLIEKESFLGGMATQALYSGWARNRGLGAVPYGGVPRELVERMGREMATSLPDTGSEAWRVPKDATGFYYNEEILKLVLGEFIAEAGADVLYHCLGVVPIMENRNIKGVIIENKSGRQAVLANAIIDASGDADIAVRAGAPCRKYAGDDERQRMPEYFEADSNPNSPFTKDHAGAVTPFDLRLVLWNIDWERADDGAAHEAWRRSHDPKLQVQLSGARRGFLWNEGMMKISMLVRGKDASDAMDLSWGETALKQAGLLFLRELRKAPGFEEAHVIKMSHQAEVRATRRVMGDYVLTRDDCVNGKRFADAIAAHPPRGLHRKTVYRNVASGTRVFHGIPYRCLLPLGIEGLLTAGRCISSEFLAFQGHLSIPGCMLLGQAAGVAAALASRQNRSPRQVEVQELQRCLTEMGAELQEGLPAPDA
jgi:hypothetical protein